MTHLFVYFLKLVSVLFGEEKLLTPYEKSKFRETATYEEIISYYSTLDQSYDEIMLKHAGMTDIGRPLHCVTVTKGSHDPGVWKTLGKIVILINNGIHPGEPEGIDASMMLARDLVTKPEYRDVLNKLVFCIIPVYNVDGCLNRNSITRLNQNGPAEYGFRANARNLDLNRDFIKCDSENARSFSRLFHTIKPDIFMDTHTSNGADYQYTMTYIATQKDKLQKEISAYMTASFIPELEKKMTRSGYEMIPYVNTKGETPESGIIAFYESPRYSTGYAALFNTIGFTLETHMLKPFPDRVEATYQFLINCALTANEQATGLREARQKADRALQQETQMPVSWISDTSSKRMISFKGYEAIYTPSNLGDVKRLYYDRQQPYIKNIPYYPDYKPEATVSIPGVYILPQAWTEVIERLKLNNVEMKRLATDTVLETHVYYIRDYKTLSSPFEGHYLHYNVKVEAEKQRINYYKGDYLIQTDQAARRYIVETLEPQGKDSYFAWNFFDEILTRKEGYSDYVFDETAAGLLKKDPELLRKFNEKKGTDKDFAGSWKQQLDFIYRNSLFYEKSYLRYPVTRMEHIPDLPFTN